MSFGSMHSAQMRSLIIPAGRDLVAGKWSERFPRDWTYIVHQPAATIGDDGVAQFEIDVRGRERRAHPS